MVEWIESRPEVLGGKPVIKGTRIPIDLILELVDSGYTVDDLVEEYPHVPREAFLHVIEVARIVHESVASDRLKKFVRQH